MSESQSSLIIIYSTTKKITEQKKAKNFVNLKPVIYGCQNALVTGDIMG